MLTTNANPSLVHLSLAPVHGRGWGSLYAALNKGRIGAEVLRKPIPGPKGFRDARAPARHAGGSAETPWQIARTAQR
jgi:hypothetical protein